MTRRSARFAYAHVAPPRPAYAGFADTTDAVATIRLQFENLGTMVKLATQKTDEKPIFYQRLDQSYKTFQDPPALYFTHTPATTNTGELFAIEQAMPTNDPLVAVCWELKNHNPKTGSFEIMRTYTTRGDTETQDQTKNGKSFNHSEVGGEISHDTLTTDMWNTSIGMLSPVHRQRVLTAFEQLQKKMSKEIPVAKGLKIPAND